MNFEEAFAEARADFGLSPRARGGEGSSAVLARWREFAELCEAGFDGYLDEYYNYLGARSVIFSMLSHPVLIAYPEIVAIAHETAMADLRVVACFNFEEAPDIDRSSLPDGSAWYWNHFPARRGAKFAAELSENYGL